MFPSSPTSSCPKRAPNTVYFINHFLPQKFLFVGRSSGRRPLLRQRLAAEFKGWQSEYLNKKFDSSAQTFLN